MNILTRITLYTCITAQVFAPCALDAAADKAQSKKQGIIQKVKSKLSASLKKLPKITKEQVIAAGATLLFITLFLFSEPQKPHFRFTAATMPRWQGYITNEMLEELYGQPRGSITAEYRQVFLNYLRVDLHTKKHSDKFARYIQTKIANFAYQLLLVPDGAEIPNPRVAMPYLEEECVICCEEMGRKYILLSCKHASCKNCLLERFDILAKEHTLKGYACPYHTCKNPISETDTRLLIGDEHAQWARYYGAMLQDSINALQKDAITHCPTPGCTQIFIKGPHAVSTNCRRCGHAWCSRCPIAHPRNISCDEAKKQQAANNQWLNTNTKPCPHCAAKIQRTDGCNRMPCTSCHNYFWWCCGKKSESYDDVHCNHGIWG